MVSNKHTVQQYIYIRKPLCVCMCGMCAHREFAVACKLKPCSLTEADNVANCHASTFGVITRVVPKVMSNVFLYANWEQQTKESAVVDGTSCCVILECLVTPIACIA